MKTPLWLWIALGVLALLGLFLAGPSPGAVYVAILDSGIGDCGIPVAWELGHDCLDSDDLAGAPPGLDDLNGHGTAVASVVADHTDAIIIPVRIAGAEARADYTDMIEGVEHVAKLARGSPDDRYVINMSYNNKPGDYADSVAAFFDALVATATDAGVLFIASAGNDGVNVDEQPVYPTSVCRPGFLSVAATDEDGELCSFSNYGRRSVDLAAVGEEIVALTPQGEYHPFHGTSFAAPWVASVAAGILEDEPDLPLSALHERLLNLPGGKPCPVVAGKAFDGGPWLMSGCSVCPGWWGFVLIPLFVCWRRGLSEQRV